MQMCSQLAKIGFGSTVEVNSERTGIVYQLYN